MSETGSDRQHGEALQARTANRVVVLVCLSLLAAMGGLTYAAVPLYKLFCQVTGFGGTTQRAAAGSGVVLDRVVIVRFDANVAPGLGWTFEPVERTREVHVGENALAFFRATNTSDHPVTGAAGFNVSPDIAGRYFTKVQCFCFTEQTLAPGQTVEMPVSFYVSPEFASDRDARFVREITLSYTFYPANAPASGAVPGQGS